MTRGATAAVVLTAGLVPAGEVSGQGFVAGAGRVVATPAADAWSGGWLLPPFGPLSVALGGIWLDGQDGTRLGPQLEFDLFRARPGNWYLVAAVSGGIGAGGAPSPWGAWNAGVGYRLLSLWGADLGLEGRYLRLSSPQGAVMVGLRLVAPFRRAVPESARPEAPPPAGATDAARSLALATRADAGLATSVVRTALDAMGAPYAWGGSSANGFDCSGLIQYAYGRHGLVLPRRSVDQARAGRLIPRDLAGLAPGDILTFSASPGGPVSHVGLYVGDGRFIHSASDGVRLSRLAADDPAGRHWFERWVGARRVLVPPAGPS